MFSYDLLTTNTSLVDVEEGRNCIGELVKGRKCATYVRAAVVKGHNLHRRPSCTPSYQCCSSEKVSYNNILDVLFNKHNYFA